MGIHNNTGQRPVPEHSRETERIHIQTAWCYDFRDRGTRGEGYRRIYIVGYIKKESTDHSRLVVVALIAVPLP